MDTKIRDIELLNEDTVSIYKCPSETPAFAQSYLFKSGGNTWKCEVVLASPILSRIEGLRGIDMGQIYIQHKCEICRHSHRVQFIWSNNTAVVGSIEQCIMCMHRPGAFEA